MSNLNENITDEKKSFEKIIDSIVLREKNSSLKVNLQQVLFSITNFNNIILKNKFCFIGNSDQFFLTSELNISDELFNYYLNVSKSNVGSIFLGGYKLPMSNKQIKKYKNNAEFKKNDFENFVEQIHSYGTKVFYTIDSCYGRAEFKNSSINNLKLSSSFNKSLVNSNLYCKRMSDKKCNKIIDLMSYQAEYAINVGFDGILINGDLFGIVGEFSSPEMNRRVFGYYNEYIDFSKNLLKKILDKNPLTKIFYKFGLKTFVSEIYENEVNNICSIKNFKGNISYKKITDLIIDLIKLGVDGFIIDIGTYETEFLNNSTKFQNDNILKTIILDINELLKNNNIKNKFNSEIFFIYNDFNYDLPNEIACEDNFLFDFTRQILADNKIINKLKINNFDFQNCIKCGFCKDKMNKKNAISCIICPENYLKSVNFEKNNKKILKSNIENEKIAIIGAGISGINATIYLLDRGYKIDLFDKNDKINYNGRLQEIFGYDYLLKYYNDYLENQLNKYNQSQNLKIHLNTDFKINENVCDYSKIIVSTGFLPKFSNIPGAVLPNVKNIYEVLNEYSNFDGKKKIVIEAKSVLSLSLAQFLLINKKEVTLIISSMDFLCKMKNSLLTYYLFSLKYLNCNVILMPKICRIESDFVEILADFKLLNQDFRSVILNYKSKKKYKLQYRAKIVDMDMFIYEPEVFSNNKLYIDLVSSKFDGEIFLIGNALQPSSFDECVKSAYFVAKNI